MSPVGPSLTSLVRPVQTVWAQDLSLGVSIFVMRNRLGLAALALSLAVGACNQDAPTGANSVSEGQETAPQFKKGSSTLLANVPVTGTASNGTIFTGTATIKKFAFDQKTGTLLVSGTVQDATGRVVGNSTGSQPPWLRLLQSEMWGPPRFAASSTSTSAPFI